MEWMEDSVVAGCKGWRTEWIEDGVGWRMECVE
jgi:hypothetical protein